MSLRPRSPKPRDRSTFRTCRKDYRKFDSRFELKVSNGIRFSPWHCWSHRCVTCSGNYSSDPSEWRLHEPEGDSLQNSLPDKSRPFRRCPRIHSKVRKIRPWTRSCFSGVTNQYIIEMLDDNQISCCQDVCLFKICRSKHTGIRTTSPMTSRSSTRTSCTERGNRRKLLNVSRKQEKMTSERRSCAVSSTIGSRDSVMLTTSIGEHLMNCRAPV